MKDTKYHEKKNIIGRKLASSGGYPRFNVTFTMDSDISSITIPNNTVNGTYAWSAMWYGLHSNGSWKGYFYLNYVGTTINNYATHSFMANESGRLYDTDSSGNKAFKFVGPEYATNGDHLIYNVVQS